MVLTRRILPTCAFRRSMGRHPVAAMIHGGFWRAQYDLGHLGHLAAAIATAGVATWNIEYRRLGNPGGGWPGTLLDVAAALNHLRAIAPQYELDLQRLILIGHSAGGQLALWYAGLYRIPTDSPIFSPNYLPPRAVVSLAGVSDLRYASELGLSARAADALIGGTPVEYPDRYAAASPCDLLPLGVAQFLFHATGDQDVPYEMSQRYAELAHSKGDDIRLFSFPGLGHFDLIDPKSPVWSELSRVVLENTRDSVMHP